MSGGTRKDKGKTRQNGGNGHTRSVVQLPHGRVPPHNIDAEQSLLGGIFLDSSAPIKALFDVCSAADFYRDRHRLIAQAMLSLFEGGIGIDRVSVVDRLITLGDLEHAGGEEYLEQLDKFVPTAANLGYYAKIVHDKAVARRLIEAAGAIAQLGYEQHGEIGDFADECERRIKKATGESRARRNQFVDAHMRFSIDELTTDPEPLPFILRPYFPAEAVSLLSASGAAGKTTLIMQLAVARALGRALFPGLIPREGETVILTTEDRKIHYLHKLAAIREQLGSDFDARLVSERIHLLDMAGLPVRFVQAEHGEQFAVTSDVDDLAECLLKKSPKADQLFVETVSRVTGGVESNPSLGALVTAGERLGRLTRIAVTFVGHVGQNAARAGAADSYAGRGGTAGSDNGRSTNILTALNDKNKNAFAPGLEIDPEEMSRLLVWAHPKVNHGTMPAKPRLLRKEITRGGMVLVDAGLEPGDQKSQQPAPARKKGSAMKYPELKQAIIDYVERSKTPVQRNEVKHSMGVRYTTTLDAIKDLITEKKLSPISSAKNAPVISFDPSLDPDSGTKPGTTTGTSVGNHPESVPVPAPSPSEGEGRGGTGNREQPTLPGLTGTAGTGPNREPGTTPGTEAKKD